jgi:type I restriction enzyme, S subunit
MSVRVSQVQGETGGIPQDWKTGRLGEFCYIKGRIGWRGLKASEYTTNGPYLVANKHLARMRVRWEACDHVSDFRYQESPEIQLRVNDVIMSKDGTLGEVAFVDYLPDRATINSTMMLLRSNPAHLLPRFLSYYIQGAQFQRFLRQKKSGTSIPHIFQADMASLQIPLPSIPEQSMISTILLSVDDAIQKTDEVIARTLQIKKGLMSRLFSDGLGHSTFKETEIGRIPKEWQVVTIGKITQVRNGTTPRRKIREYWENGSIPWIPTAQVNERYISQPSEYVTKRAFDETSLPLVPKGAILLAMIGQGVTRGKVAKLLIDATINQNFAAIFPSEEVNMDFVFHYLDSKYPQIRNLGRGGNQWALNCEVVRGIRIPKPSLDEQRRIGAILTEIDVKVEKENERNNVLRQLKTGLMQVLLTGKVRVKVN